MRAFSTIEMLIALMIATTAIIAISLIVLGMPLMVGNMRLENEALSKASELLSEIREKYYASSTSATPLASTTDGVFTKSVAIRSLEDEAYSDVSANISWEDVFGRRETIGLTTRIAYALSTDDTCDPFVSGNWSKPILIGTYSFNSTDGIISSNIASDTYPISSLAISGNILAAGIRSTNSASSSTLFLFSLADHESPPKLLAGFDNASSSKIGFSSLASGNGPFFAGNGFGSASTPTCSNDLSCAQVQVFSSSGSAGLQRTSALFLSTSTPPYAFISGGSTAPVHTLFYYHHLLYLGLDKTAGGSEFNIVDAHDPSHMKWLGGISIGRSITAITVRGIYAYLGTDDPARELIVLDIHDPKNPSIVGSFNAPGSTGFGYGAALTAYEDVIRFGRTYVGNAPEFFRIDASDLTHLSIHDAHDFGTTQDPESVRGIITQDYLSYILLTHRLEFWKTVKEGELQQYAPPITVESGEEGTAIACRGNIIYIGGFRTSDGQGFIKAYKGS